MIARQHGTTFGRHELSTHEPYRAQAVDTGKRSAFPSAVDQRVNRCVRSSLQSQRIWQSLKGFSKVYIAKHARVSFLRGGSAQLPNRGFPACRCPASVTSSVGHNRSPVARCWLANPFSSRSEHRNSSRLATPSISTSLFSFFDLYLSLDGSPSIR
jgi:hypothetical protein